MNEFLYEYYWNIKPNHKSVICNQTTYALLTHTEKDRVVFIQTNSKKRVIIKKGISIFASPSNIRGKGSILRYGTFIRKPKIPQKYLDKLGAKYRNFQVSEFSEYRFERKYIYSWLTSEQHAYRHYLWPSYSGAIF